MATAMSQSQMSSFNNVNRRQAAQFFLLYTHSRDVKRAVKLGWLTYELCYEAVQINPECVSGLPKNYKCVNIYLAAVKADGKILAEVPHIYKTLRVCVVALANGADMKYVPRKYQRVIQTCL